MFSRLIELIDRNLRVTGSENLERLRNNMGLPQRYHGLIWLLSLSDLKMFCRIVVFMIVLRLLPSFSLTSYRFFKYTTQSMMMSWVCIPKFSGRATMSYRSEVFPYALQAHIGQGGEEAWKICYSLGRKKSELRVMELKSCYPVKMSQCSKVSPSVIWVHLSMISGNHE